MVSVSGSVSPVDPPIDVPPTTITGGATTVSGTATTSPSLDSSSSSLLSLHVTSSVLPPSLPAPFSAISGVPGETLTAAATLLHHLLAAVQLPAASSGGSSFVPGESSLRPHAFPPLPGATRPSPALPPAILLTAAVHPPMAPPANPLSQNPNFPPPAAALPSPSLIAPSALSLSGAVVATAVPVVPLPPPPVHSPSLTQLPTPQPRQTHKISSPRPNFHHSHLPFLPLHPQILPISSL